jgi:signal transduction histidine kinase
MSVTDLLNLLGAWPLALAFAAVAGAERLRWRRRRTALNRALHELRRPLQALTLMSAVRGAPAAGTTDRSTRTSHAPDTLDTALAALADLDREVNGGASQAPARPVSCRAMVEGAIERWRGPAAAAGRALELRWRAGAAIVLVDPIRIARAIDNLLANAIEHGGLNVAVDVSLGADGVRIRVLDPGGAGRDLSAGARRAADADPRRGHGLALVAATAAAHGGRFSLRTGRITVAELVLPLAAAPMPAAEPSRARIASRPDGVIEPSRPLAA